MLIPILVFAQGGEKHSTKEQSVLSHSLLERDPFTQFASLGVRIKLGQLISSSLNFL
jgi:hypothetical protein